MKAPSPAFSLYPKDILSDEQCTVMSDEELGAYLRLLCHAWLEGSIPSDPIRLQRLLHMRPAKLKKLWPALEPCFFEQDGRLFQRRLENERVKQTARNLSQARRGMRGGRPIKSTKEESRKKPGVNPEKSLPSPSPSPSPSAVTNNGLTDLQPAAATPPFKSAKAVDIYRRFYPDGEPSPVMLKALKPLVAKHGWDAVEPEMEAFLASSNTTFRSWPKFAEGFGTWARGQPPNGNGAGRRTEPAGPSAKALARMRGMQALVTGRVPDGGRRDGLVPGNGGAGGELPGSGRGGRGEGDPRPGLPAGVAALPDGPPVAVRGERGDPN